MKSTRTSETSRENWSGVFTRAARKLAFSPAPTRIIYFRWSELNDAKGNRPGSERSQHKLDVLTLNSWPASIGSDPRRRLEKNPADGTLVMGGCRDQVKPTPPSILVDGKGRAHSLPR